MKIKILKDIPGYKKDEVLDCSKYRPSKYDYKVSYLIEDGYAEEVEDEIDIEEIRDMLELCAPDIIFTDSVTNVFMKGTSPKELQWFSAYRVVSEVIRQLNGDWINNRHVGWIITYELKSEWDYTGLICELGSCLTCIPVCKDLEVGKKVIDLCTPELKILFNIK
jgi:hypothetical protein